MHGNAPCPTIVVFGAGSRLLAGLAYRPGATGGFGDVLAGLRERRAGHQPGRVLVDVAVMLTDGGTTSSDLRCCGTSRRVAPAPSVSLATAPTAPSPPAASLT